MGIGRRFYISIGYSLLFIGVEKVCAQDTKDSVEISVRPYASLRGHVAVYDNKMELQENASRIGMELNIKKGNFGFIAGGEVQLNMFKGGTSFNVDGNLSGGFLTLESAQTQQVFGNRLGYLGLDLGKFGTLTIGKQWSVYRDVTFYTDRFNVFGARASATFVGGTDGGEPGTGRADQSIIYRNRLGPLHIGGQIQAKGRNNGKFLDGFGFSLQYEFRDGLFMGMAYNRALLNDDLVNGGKVVGLTGQPTYYSLGAKYIGRIVDLSVVGILQRNGDFSQGSYWDPTYGMMPVTAVFNAKGLEVFGRYKFQKFSVQTGYNLYVPDVKYIENTSIHNIDGGFKKNDIIVGISYSPFKFTQIYCEQRLSMGKTVTGERERSVFTLGLRIDLSGGFSKKIEL